MNEIISNYRAELNTIAKLSRMQNNPEIIQFLADEYRCTLRMINNLQFRRVHEAFTEGALRSAA